jgi:DNA-binding NarL/FixJ family response regulator
MSDRRQVMAAEHTLMAQALAEFVKQQPDLEVVGHVQSPHALVRQCRTGCVDVVSQG